MTATAGMCQEHYYASVNTQSKYKIWVRLCMSCGHLDSADLDAQIAAASEEAARVAQIKITPLENRLIRCASQDHIRPGSVAAVCRVRTWDNGEWTVCDEHLDWGKEQAYAALTPPTQGLAEEEGKS